MICEYNVTFHPQILSNALSQQICVSRPEKFMPVHSSCSYSPAPQFCSRHTPRILFSLNCTLQRINFCARRRAEVRFIPPSLQSDHSSTPRGRPAPEENSIRILRSCHSLEFERLNCDNKMCWCYPVKDIEYESAPKVRKVPTQPGYRYQWNGQSWDLQQIRVPAVS